MEVAERGALGPCSLLATTTAPDHRVPGKVNTTEDDDRFADDFVEQEVREAANERAALGPVNDCVRSGVIEQRSRGRVEGALKLFAESFALIVIPRASLGELLRSFTREPEIQSLGLHATLNFFERE